MIITVKKPGDCPLRLLKGETYLKDGFYRCHVTGLRCNNDKVFSTHCPVRVRTVIVQKEETETIPNQKEKPVTAEVKSDE